MTGYVACAMAILAGASCAAAWGQEPSDSARNVKEGWDASTGLNDQTGVAVTIYNSNLALVRDRRKLTLPTGEFRLQFADVAQQIRPETVSLHSLSHPGSLLVLEQNYEFDLISPTKLLEKYVGKKVRLVKGDADSALPSTEATVLSVNEGPVYQVGDEIYLGYPGQVVLPEIPENLVARPSLVWLLDNRQGEQEVEATYLTNGIRWSADYVANYDEASGKLDLTGWVTLTNESGATYTNATLKLVAGDVNIVQPPMANLGGGRVMKAEFADASQPMVEEAFGEYHLYTLQRPTTIRQNQTKQVNLLTASQVGAKKVYRLKGEQYFFMQIMPPMPNQKVGVFLQFQNEEKNQLGMPLPAGVVRVYQQDKAGTLQFVGEDRIEHTPKNEEVELKLGNAFDVVAERTQTDYRQISDRVHESAYKIKLRNHKTEAITVEVLEPMSSDWRILQSSIPYEKKDAFTAQFNVAVPADGETILEYRVQVRF